MCQALFMALGGGAVIKINDLLLWSLHSSSRKQIRRKKKKKKSKLIQNVSGDKC